MVEKFYDNRNFKILKINKKTENISMLIIVLCTLLLLVFFLKIKRFYINDIGLFFSAFGYSFVLVIFIKERLFLLYVLPLLLCQRSLGCVFGGPFLCSVFYSIDLSILSPVPHCLDYCSFIICPKVR